MLIFIVVEVWITWRRNRYQRWAVKIILCNLICFEIFSPFRWGLELKCIKKWKDKWGYCDPGRNYETEGLSDSIHLLKPQYASLLELSFPIAILHRLPHFGYCWSFFCESGGGRKHQDLRSATEIPPICVNILA